MATKCLQPMFAKADAAEARHAYTIFRTFVVVAVLLQIGCTRNISNDPDYPTDYVIGGIYAVQRPLIASTEGSLLAPGFLTLSDTVESQAIKGTLVPDGTLIEISKLIYTNRIGTTFIWVEGKFLTGVLESDAVELVFVSSLEGSVPMVNEHYLKLITSP